MNKLVIIGIARGGCFLLACTAVTLEAGCAARVYSEPSQVYTTTPVGDDSVVYVDTVPANIEVYPHYYYGDGYAYYVDGRWYHRGPRGWGYYRQEPPELERRRVYIQQQPAPVPERSHVQQSPEAPREERRVVEGQPHREEAQPRREEGQHRDEAQPRREEWQHRDEAQPRRDDSRKAPPAEKRAEPHHGGDQHDDHGH